MHTFFCDNIGEPGTPVQLEKQEEKHLFKTLRASAGEQIQLFDGQGKTAYAEITLNRNIIIQTVEKHSEPDVKIHLFVAPPRKQKMDQLLKQTAETGVWAIHPILTERAVSTPDKVSDRWLVLLREGCKQSGNPFLPQLSAPQSLPEALTFLKDQNISAYFGAVPGQESQFTNIPTGELAWLVGPEGGFSPNEEELLRTAGVSGLNLGPYIMRVETAAICGIAVLMRGAMKKMVIK
jgi:16S rRNA (uracil1498-N3)-methyltransferase